MAMPEPNVRLISTKRGNFRVEVGGEKMAGVTAVEVKYPEVVRELADGTKIAERARHPVVTIEVIGRFVEFGDG